MDLNTSSINLTELAKQAMLERGFYIDFLPGTDQEIQTIKEEVTQISSIKDMREKLWFSLDNDNSRDLDQLTYAEQVGDIYKIYIAVADVASFVKRDSPIYQYAAQNTTSVYTPSIIFTMLPNALSFDLTSLNENVDRQAIISEVDVNKNGEIIKFIAYSAQVNNKAKLAYNSVSSWLDNTGPVPDRLTNQPALQEQVLLQNKIAKSLKAWRHAHGSLTLETYESTHVLKGEKIIDLVLVLQNSGKDIIEEFMVAANTSMAQLLEEKGCPFLIRIVRVPKNWDRIVEIASEYGENLPETPDALALEQFLIRRRAQEPEKFKDLSLLIIKLIGRGEYIVEMPGEEPVGHFNLALKNYTHSTAPNRRFVDIINQIIFLSNLIEQKACPFTKSDLEALAEHCTQKEDDANKVERKMKKSAAILILSTKMGQTFDGVITGASSKGTWIQIQHPFVEGKVVQGYKGLKVGDKIKVRLIHYDIQKGYIDFARE